MKKELKEKIVAWAKKDVDVEEIRESILFDASPKVMIAPDAYWVQAWIHVPLEASMS